MKNLSQISDNKDIITKEYIVARYEPLLPTGTSGILKRASNGVWTLDTTALGDMTIAIYGGSASGIVAKSDALKETRAGTTEKVWVGTKAQYNAIVTKDTETCYITTDETYGSYISLDETGHILASYMPLSVSAHVASTSNPHGVTKSQVGLGNVNNTADIDKPISLYVQAALDLKAASNHTHSTYAPINNPTFTGTVSGITATMVGLSNVTNESKSTMFANPTFTGIAKATGNTSYTTSQLRNIFLNTTIPTSGDGSNGDVWIVYT